MATPYLPSRSSLMATPCSPSSPPLSLHDLLSPLMATPHLPSLWHCREWHMPYFPHHLPSLSLAFSSWVPLAECMISVGFLTLIVCRCSCCHALSQGQHNALLEKLLPPICFDLLTEQALLTFPCCSALSASPSYPSGVSSCSGCP